MGPADWRDYLGNRRRVHLKRTGESMNQRHHQMVGSVITVAAVLLWGFVNAEHRPPVSIPAWSWCAAAGTLLLAALHQSFMIRGRRGEQRRFLVGRLAVALLLAAVLAFVGAAVGLLLERVFSPPNTSWAVSLVRSAWHALAVFTVLFASTPPACHYAGTSNDGPR
jgi:bacteriorhodopsin